MASQTFIVAAIAGLSAGAIRNRFAAWKNDTLEDHEDSIPDVDKFCEALRGHSRELPILYYSEWVDRWMFAADIFDVTWFDGHRFSVCSMSPEQVNRFSARPSQHQENAWLAARLREACSAWKPMAKDVVILMAREVFASSTLDAEIFASLDTVPQWID